MKKERNGFTITELLAIIVMFIIVILITVPIVMNIISKTKKSAFKDITYGIIKAGEAYYANLALDGNALTETKTFTFPNNIKELDLKGNLPTGGNVKINNKGKIELAISNGTYCIRKDYNDNDITIDKDLENCSLLEDEDVTKESNRIIVTNNKCLTKGICENGTKLNIKVNNNKNYDFYVINDDGINLTLIMDSNLEEYASGNEYSFQSNEILTVIEVLEDMTQKWTNIQTYNYTYTDNEESKYSKITRNNVRARLLNYKEAIGLGCEIEKRDSCPSYLYKNLKSSNSEDIVGYWLSDTSSDTSNTAMIILHNGSIDNYSLSGISNIGIRPVIKIPKTV